MVNPSRRERLRLTIERMDRGWSKAELARRARIDQGTLSKIESGRLQPYEGQLMRLARALHVADAARLFELLDG